MLWFEFFYYYVDDFIDFKHIYSCIIQLVDCIYKKCKLENNFKLYGETC